MASFGLSPESNLGMGGPSFRKSLELKEGYGRSLGVLQEILMSIVSRLNEVEWEG